MGDGRLRLLSFTWTNQQNRLIVFEKIIYNSSIYFKFSHSLSLSHSYCDSSAQVGNSKNLTIIYKSCSCYHGGGVNYMK